MKRYTWRKLNSVARRLNNNEIAILPTSGVYGIFAKVNSSNHTSINALKRSESNKPLSVMFSNIDHVFQAMEIPVKLESLVRENLPGLTTFILKPKKVWISDNGFDFLGETVGVRVPTDYNLMKLLSKTGPMFTTSANLTGYQTITTLEEASVMFSKQVVLEGDEMEVYENKEAKVSFMLDDGKLGLKPSTIIDATTDTMKIIRAVEVGIGVKDAKELKDIKSVDDFKKEEEAKVEKNTTSKEKTPVKKEVKPTKEKAPAKKENKDESK